MWGLQVQIRDLERENRRLRDAINRAIDRHAECECVGGVCGCATAIAEILRKGLDKAKQA